MREKKVSICNDQSLVKIFFKDDANEDDEKRCFICGIERSEFDKRNKVSIHEFCDYCG